MTRKSVSDKAPRLAIEFYNGELLYYQAFKKICGSRPFGVVGRAMVRYVTEHPEVAQEIVKLSDQVA